MKMPIAAAAKLEGVALRKRQVVLRGLWKWGGIAGVESERWEGRGEMRVEKGRERGDA